MTTATHAPHPAGPTSRPDDAGYLENGPFTDPRDLSARLDRLVARALAQARGERDGPRALAEAVRSVMVHPFWRHAYGLPEDEPRTPDEVNLRDVRAALDRIGTLEAALGRSPDDPAPLPASHKLVGNCRHHAVLHAALLRRTGVPARARCGFAGYFEAGRWVDHWVVERRDAGRWVISDPQLDDVQRKALGFAFDPLDLPDGAFVSGGEAWLACRAGDDPGRYGIMDLHGWDFVKGNVVRDVCALGGKELLPWDVWGLAAEPHAGLAPAALAALDAAARATPMRASLDAAEAATLARADGFRVPRRVESWFTGAPVEVDLGPLLGR